MHASCLTCSHGSKRLRRFRQFPGEVVDVEEEQRFRIRASEFLKYPPLPAFGQMRFGIDILSEEAAFIGNAEEIEYNGHHIQVRNEYGLPEVFGKILVVLR